MPLRLSERFKIDEPVEIFITQIQMWLPGRVARFDPPGMWVRTGEELGHARAQHWFVTNGRRVRSPQSASSAETALPPTDEA